MKFPEITLTGTPYEMGLQFGRQCGAEIRKLLQAVLPEERETALKKTAYFLPLYEAYMPEMLEELYGTAEGAGISREESLFLQTRWDLSSVPAGQCTSYAIKAPAARNGAVYAGINKDVNAFSREQMILVHMVPKTGKRKLICAYYGSLAGPGMNDRGVCFFGNSLYGDAPKPGIPQPMLMRLILDSATTQEAVTRLTALMDAGVLNSNGNATICDEAGDMCCLEHIGGNYAILRPGERGFLVHANHVISGKAELLSREHPELSGNTFGRQARMEQLFSEQAGSLDEKAIAAVLRDHEGGAFAICRHDAVMLGRQPSCTILSFIGRPDRKTALIAKGNPCENEYYEYRV